MASLTNWIKKNIVSKYMMSSCPDEKRCLQLLEEILDNESTSVEEAKYYSHIDQCWTCFNNYNLEKAIRELIKSKIANKPVPEGLLEKIKFEIDKSPNT
jgi:anti-sigma factor (TIGR02949 family)